MNNSTKTNQHHHRKSYLATIVALASLMATTTTTEARSYGGSGSSTHRLVPRGYYYNRPATRDPFDMISDIFTMPIYMNSLLKQQQQQQQQQHNQDVVAHAVHSTPRYTVSEDPHTGVVELEMELPGVKAKDLDIELENGSLLRIKGSRSTKQSGKSEFDQLFELDKNVDPERIEVSLSDGILSVRAPKREKVVKKIEILVKGGDDAKEEEPLSVEATDADSDKVLGDDEFKITTEDS